MGYRPPAEQSNVNITRKKRPVEVKSRRRRSVPEKRGPSRRLVIFIAIIVFLSVVVTASLTVLFKVDRVDVQGNTRYTADEIILKSELKTGDNLFLTDVGDAPDKLYSAFPYIETVKVSRKLPGRLLITVTEAEEFAAVSVEGGYRIINENGRLLEQAADNKGLLKVQCAVEEAAARESIVKAETLKSLNELSEFIKQLEFEGVSGISLESEFSIRVIYKDRIEIKLGTMIYADLKLRHCQVRIQELEATDQNRKGTMDCSFYTPENPKAVFAPAR